MRVQLDTKPEEIDELQNEKSRLEVEVNALEKEKDKASQARLPQVFIYLFLIV